MTQADSPLMTPLVDFTRPASEPQRRSGPAQAANEAVAELSDAAVDRLLESANGAGRQDDPMAYDALVAAARDGECHSEKESEHSGFASTAAGEAPHSIAPDLLKSSMD